MSKKTTERQQDILNFLRARKAKFQGVEKGQWVKPIVIDKMPVSNDDLTQLCDQGLVEFNYKGYCRAKGRACKW